MKDISQLHAFKIAVRLFGGAAYVLDTGKKRGRFIVGVGSSYCRDNPKGVGATRRKAIEAAAKAVARDLRKGIKTAAQLIATAYETKKRMVSK